MSRFAGSLLAFSLFVAAMTFGCGRVEYAQLPDSGSSVELKIGDKTVHAELALDDVARQQGLKYRPELPENSGMLFCYDKDDAKKLSFWMKDTEVPLSIAFLSDEGEVLQIEHMRPHDERRTRSKMEVRFALEMNQRWFERNGIDVGSRLGNFEEVTTNLPIRQEDVSVR